MATISKFYLLDAATPNLGTMPTNSATTIAGGKLGTGTEATGNTTARDTSDVPGTANPDTESLITAQAVGSGTRQRLGHRRFVTRPLAATTFAAADGNWTFSRAVLESNTNHTNGTGQGPIGVAYLWRPTTGLRVGTIAIAFGMTASMTTSEQAVSDTAAWSGTQAIIDGDILVFDVYSDFFQSMATAYTDSFAYNGTTEASTTTCASFISPPSALTLFTGVVPRNPAVHIVDPAVV